MNERAKRSILLIGFLMLSPSVSYAQAKPEKLTIKVEPDVAVVDGGVKSLTQSCKLYTVAGGRQSFIADLVRDAVDIPVPLVDPTNTYVFYASNIGCGSDGDGMAIWVSDALGENQMPILGRCRYL